MSQNVLQFEPQYLLQFCRVCLGRYDNNSAIVAGERNGNENENEHELQTKPIL